MGWLRSVGSFQLQVSFAKEPYKRHDILQKRPTILRSLLIAATPPIHESLWIRRLGEHLNFKEPANRSHPIALESISNESSNPCEVAQHPPQRQEQDEQARYFGVHITQQQLNMWIFICNTQYGVHISQKQVLMWIFIYTIPFGVHMTQKQVCMWIIIYRTPFGVHTSQEKVYIVHISREKVCMWICIYIHINLNVHV